MKNLTIIIATLTLFLTTNCHWINRNPQNPKPNNMTSQFNNDRPIAFESFSIMLSHMRGTEMYTCTKTANAVFLEYYMPASAYNNETKEHEDIITNMKVIKGDQKLYDEICGWFEEYDIKSWNGFKGHRLIRVLDGITLDFRATLSDGSEIRAEGNNKYPKKYREFEQKLNELFSRKDLVDELEEPIAIENFELRILGARGSRELYTGERTETGIHLEYCHPTRTRNPETGYPEEVITKIDKAVDGDQQLYEKLCKTFNDCRVDHWDGFDGPNPPETYDGFSIEFKAQLTNGKKITASGCNNFPQTYFYVYNAIQKAFGK